MKILAIDPGTTKSGLIEFEEKEVDGVIMPNDQILEFVYETSWDHIAIEMVASYGMAVGRDVFETCVWIGRFVQAAEGRDVRRVYRKQACKHICNSANAKDPNIRQALIDIFPATGGGKTPQIGTKKQPGPLYGMKSHLWAALAVAVTAADLWDELERF